MRMQRSLVIARAVGMRRVGQVWVWVWRIVLESTLGGEDVK